MNKRKPIQPKITVRLFRDNKGFGPGIAELLSRVDVHHSLRAAAASMQMAYSKAWKILKASEQVLGFPLLSRTTGGQGGGGAELTAKGRALLNAYQNYTQTLQQYAEQLGTEFFSDF